MVAAHLCHRADAGTALQVHPAAGGAVPAGFERRKSSRSLFCQLVCPPTTSTFCSHHSDSFDDGVLHPLMKKAKRKNSAHVLLFMDASHFVLGCDFLGGIYSKSLYGIKVRTVRGNIYQVYPKLFGERSDQFAFLVDKIQICTVFCRINRLNLVSIYLSDYSITNSHGLIQE